MPRKHKKTGFLPSVPNGRPIKGFRRFLAVTDTNEPYVPGARVFIPYREQQDYPISEYCLHLVDVSQDGKTCIAVDGNVYRYDQ